MIGVLCLWRGPNWAIVGLILATGFGAAAAVLIDLITVPPAHVFLAFVGIALLMQRGGIDHLIDCFRPPKAGFWLLALVVYAVLGAFFFPRLFEGVTYIVPLSDREDAFGGLAPLQPTTGNITQSIYMVGNLGAFGIACAVSQMRGGTHALLYGFIALAVANVLFAIIDLATYSTGTTYLLEFMRNSTYALHTESEINGLKRIVGSYTEASYFGRICAALLGFTATLWLCGRHTILSGVLALVTLVLLLFSTSSAALAVFPILMLVLYGTALQLSVTHARPMSTVMVAIVPLFVIVAFFGVMLIPTVSSTLSEYISDSVFDKLSTDSGVERSGWNATAMQNFMDTWGMGVGVGTARASSLLFALLSSVGLIGFLCYLLMFASIITASGSKVRSMEADLALAARNACLGCLIGDLLVATTIDQGLLFYLFAAAAVSATAPARSPAPAMQPRMEPA